MHFIYLTVLAASATVERAKKTVPYGYIVKPFHDYDLVVTDMTMPQMAGDVLVAKLLKIKPTIPIILCTGYSKKLQNETEGNLGIKALVYKPIVMSDFANTVRKVLDESR